MMQIAENECIKENQESVDRLLRSTFEKRKYEFCNFL